MHPLMWCTKKGITGRNVKPEHKQEEALHKPILKDILQNNQPVYFKNVKVMKDQERQRNCPRLKGTEFAGSVTVLWLGGSDSGVGRAYPLVRRTEGVSLLYCWAQERVLWETGAPWGHSECEGGRWQFLGRQKRVGSSQPESVPCCPGNKKAKGDRQADTDYVEMPKAGSISFKSITML